ncbi:MAG: extracellular solute-binding protein [Treponema sp.]|jgi:putative aldouronate transport system substrate-binding protein|nr:extracellular solute-binding protein [Treponema sp.]
MKKPGTIFLVFLALFASALWATGKKEAGEVEKITLTLATADNTYGLSTDPELQDAITKLIEAKTNVVLSPIIPPLASYTEKLSTLINSGDIPDIFAVSQAMTRIPQMIAREQVLDLTAYIAKAPGLSKLNPAVFNDLKTNGKIYSTPYNYPKAKAIYLRQDIMTQYGINLSHTPTTEEFSREMKKLTGTGIVPFCFPKWVDNFQYFYNSFGAWGGVYKKNGAYIDGFQTPEMKQALAYLVQLYKDKILNQEFLTTENNAMREQTYTGKAASDIDYVSNYINYVQNTAAANKPTEMFLIYKITGPNGNGGSLNEATQTVLAVSSKTKNPEAAVRVIDTIVTDLEVYQAFFGIGLEGHHYTLDANRFITPTAKASSSGFRYTLNYLSDSLVPYNLNNLSFALDKTLVAGVNSQASEIIAMQANLGPNHSADVPVGLSVTYDRVSPSIKSTRESVAAKIIIGSVSIDEGLAEYANFWNSIEGPRILTELNSPK